MPASKSVPLPGLQARFSTISAYGKNINSSMFHLYSNGMIMKIIEDTLSSVARVSRSTPTPSQAVKSSYREYDQNIMVGAFLLFSPSM